MFDYVILYGNALEGVVNAIGPFNSEMQCEQYREEFPTDEWLVTKIIALETPDEGEWNGCGF